MCLMQQAIIKLVGGLLRMQTHSRREIHSFEHLLLSQALLHLLFHLIVTTCEKNSIFHCAGEETEVH